MWYFTVEKDNCKTAFKVTDNILQNDFSLYTINVNCSLWLQLCVPSPGVNTHDIPPMFGDQTRTSIHQTFPIPRNRLTGGGNLMFELYIAYTGTAVQKQFSVVIFIWGLLVYIGFPCLCIFPLHRRNFWDCLRNTSAIPLVLDCCC